MAMSKRDRENLNPTPEAIAAMALFACDYEAQTGGSMDFWKSLAPYQKDRCRELVARILHAHAHQ